MASFSNREEQILYYQKLENKLEQLAALMSSIFQQEKLNQFREYIDVGEYGLALDNAQWLFMTDGRDVPLEALHLMRELAGTMGIPLHASLV